MNNSDQTLIFDGCVQENRQDFSLAQTNNNTSKCRLLYDFDKKYLTT